MSRSQNLVWIDLEMTGLDPERDVILEIATIVTDKDLHILEEGPNLVVSQPEALLDKMDAWNTEHHGASGLTERVLASQTSLREAEAQTMAFLRRHTEPNQSPLCGNTIAQDRRFLYRYMPELSSYLHYRNVDVSSIKELVYRWYPRPYHAPKNPSNHRALDDIKGSIDELRWYRDQVFVQLH